VIGAFFVLGLVLTISRGAWLGLALALIAWPLASARWNWRQRIGLACGVLVALVAFGAALFFGSPSVRDRMMNFVHDSGETTRPIMWRAAWRLWRERPAVGSGAGSYNVRFEKYRPEQFLNEPQWAHNDYLNTLSDYGYIGFLLFFGASAVIAWRAVRHRELLADDGVDWLDAPATTAALAVGLLAFGLQLFVDFHFKIPALAMAFAILSAFVVQRRWPGSDGLTPRTSMARLWALLGSAGALIFAAAFLIPHFRAEALRYRSRQAIDRLANSEPDPAAYRAALIPVRADLARAVAIDPSNAQAWTEIAYADSLWAHAEPRETVALGASAELAANRTLALSNASGEFWIRRGVARDMQNHWLEAGEDFGHALELMPQTSLAWYYYGYHLSLNPRQRALAEAAVNFCLRLDPANGPGLALRHHLAITAKAP
jgi:MFS family permease